MKPQFLIFGCGYLGLPVARQWQALGGEIHVVTRSAARGEIFRNLGLTPIIADVMRPESLRNLPRAESILYAVGHDRSAGIEQRDLYVRGLSNVLETIAQRADRFLYVSSTGVYGDSSEPWVSEESPCAPNTPGGIACWEAEQVLRGHPVFQRSIVLRLSGIYGPGRIPRLTELQFGAPISAAEGGYLNLIHVDDAVQAVNAALTRGILGETYLISDGNPVSRREYLAELARLAKAPPPNFVAPPPGTSTRGSANRKISNQKMLAQLGVKLRMPSYREGLAAILGLSENPFAR